MIQIKRSIVAPVVCVLMAMSLQGCEYVYMQVAGIYIKLFQSSPLCDAIVSDNVDRAMQLVKHGEDVNAGSGCALLRAAERGQLELVKLLLEYKADPNRYASAELTPLTGAVMSRDVQVVRMLLEGGANPRNDLYAFQVVLNFVDADMAELLLRHGANANMMPSTTKSVYAFPDHQMVEVQLRDLELDRIDATARRLQCTLTGGENLLHHSRLLEAMSLEEDGRDRRDRIVELLIGGGADVNARTFNGATPLMKASSQHNHRIMTILMDAGADVTATDRCGRTAADYAVLHPQHNLAHLAPQTKALLHGRQRK
jgi:ankyrin repeat protein